VSINWIDSDAPTATVEYFPSTATSGDVLVMLQPSKTLIGTPV
jgi:hypothetical protein